MNFELSAEQRRIYDIIENNNDNFLVTGKAGTGKSVLLKYFVMHTKKKVAVVAPTGVSAIVIGGQTIHSFFGLKPSLQNPLEAGKINESHRKIFEAIDTLVIDEVSMVRSDIMDMIDLKLRISRKKHNEAFGGCQIIAFGDLYQISPVLDKDEIVQKYIFDNYGTEFFFGTKGVSEKPFKLVELQEVHRQSDETYIDILNNIRIGNVTKEILDKINSRHIDVEDDSKLITLTPTRAAADLVNKEKLSQLNNKEYIYRGELSGDFSIDEVPNDVELKLKVGAQIIMIKNDSAKRWINGSVGYVCELGEDFIKINIDGFKYIVSKEIWTKFRYKYDNQTHTIIQEEIGTFKQYPLQLAYALTIHKSQGQTYDKVMVDYSVGRAFTSGQTYVALSRCKRIDGLFLSEKIIGEDIKVNQIIVSYLNGNFQHEFKEISMEEIERLGNKKHVEIKWLANNSIKAEKILSPKKITGTRLPGILGFDRYKNPFTIWCAIMHVFEEEFVGNKFTEAGRAIEPTQIKYLKKLYGTKILSPDDKYGLNAKENMRFDFFKENEVFGGMWDAVLQENGYIKAIFEIKTVSAKKRLEWNIDIPKNYKIQAALYAWLLGVDDIYIVASFIEGKYYDSPETFECNSDNTKIFHLSLSKDFPGFEDKYIRPALKWWSNHVDAGISPIYSIESDKTIIDNLKKR